MDEEPSDRGEAVSKVYVTPDQWPIHHANTWLPAGPPGRRTDRGNQHVYGVVLHHTVSAEHREGTRAELTGIAHHNIATGGPGVPYHLVIDRAGEVYLCNHFGWVLPSQGGGKVPPGLMANTNFISVAMLGTYTDTELPLPMAKAMCWLWMLLRYQFHIFPDMLFGHGELKSTLCPGQGGKALVANIIGGELPIARRMSDDTRDHQRMLNMLYGEGRKPLAVDGILGPKTRKRWQLVPGVLEHNVSPKPQFRAMYRLHHEHAVKTA